MKKALIAGAASAVLAALPVVGAFAATSIQDKIIVTVSDSCAFSRTAGEGEYTTSLLADSVVENFGASTFEVKCNADDSNTKDFVVTAEFQNLSDGAGNSINYAAATPTTAASTWVAMAANATGTNTAVANNGNLIAGTANSTNKSFATTVRYSVSAAAGQATGTYTGYATYTLAVNN